MWTDDALADFHSHDARQEAELRRCPICCCCETPIQEDCYYETEEGIYCEDCFDEKVVQPFWDEHKKWTW